MGIETHEGHPTGLRLCIDLAPLDAEVLLGVAGDRPIVAFARELLMEAVIVLHNQDAEGD